MGRYTLWPAPSFAEANLRFSTRVPQLRCYMTCTSCCIWNTCHHPLTWNTAYAVLHRTASNTAYTGKHIRAWNSACHQLTAQYTITNIMVTGTAILGEQVEPTLKRNLHGRIAMPASSFFFLGNHQIHLSTLTTRGPVSSSKLYTHIQNCAQATQALFTNWAGTLYKPHKPFLPMGQQPDISVWSIKYIHAVHFAQAPRS